MESYIPLPDSILLVCSWYFLWIWILLSHRLALADSGEIRLLKRKQFYIHFLIKELTNISLDENLVDTFTAIFFFIAFAFSIYGNVRGRMHKGQKG